MIYNATLFIITSESPEKAKKRLLLHFSHLFRITMHFYFKISYRRRDSNGFQLADSQVIYNF